MRILVFSWRDPRHLLAGGAEQVMHEHMKGWVAAGHEVVLFASRIVGYPKKEEILDGIKIIRKGYQLLGVNIAGFFWYVFGKHPKFDLIVDEFHGIPFFTPLYVRARKLAVLQEVAKEVWFKNHLPSPFNVLVGAMGYVCEPLIFLFYKKIPFMVGSNSAKEDLKRMGIPERNIFIVPHGVLVKRPRGNIKKEKKPTVVFLGALARDKGVEDALKAFSYLIKKGDFITKGWIASDWQFWVIGRGGQPYLNFLKKMTKNFGLAKKVKFWGFVSAQKKFELLARAHILINPSIREGWGLVNIEANSTATPVVAYNSPGLVDSIKNGVSGIICKHNTPEELAKNIMKILSNKKLYKKLQKGSLDWRNNFSWEKSRKLSHDLLTRLHGWEYNRSRP